jgi:hypothetical protein
MSTKIQSWSEDKDDDLWLHERALKTDIEYAQTEIKNLRAALQTEIQSNNQFEEKFSDLRLVATDLANSMSLFLDVIDSAGLLNLSNGVQLGRTAWYCKASTGMKYAQEILGKARKALDASSHELPDPETSVTKTISQSTPGINQPSYFSSPENAIAYIKGQPKPVDALLDVVRANIEIEEYTFASDVIQEFGSS